MTYITLSGNYGYTVYAGRDIAAGSTIDATNASWIESNSANQMPDADTSYLEGSGKINTHPFIIYSAGAGLTIKGGAIWGEVPQYSDWQYSYNNSAAIRIDGAPGVTIEDWRIDKAWDGIRIRGNSNNFLIDDVHMSNVRDDGIENDFALSGTVRDSLLDGVFVGMALDNAAALPGNTVTFENVMIRSESYLYNGEMTHGSFFKTNTSAPETTPDIRLINSVFAIEDVTPIHISRLKLAWDNVVESHGNVFLNLSDTPLPSTYPKPPAGFTILQGQVARDYWEKCKAAWIANHDGVGDSALTALPALPGASAEPAPTPTPPGEEVFKTFDTQGRLSTLDQHHADGTRTFINIDEASNESFTQNWFNYDTQSRLDSQDVLYDNGTHTFINFDQAGNQSFTQNWFNYDAQGRLDSQDVRNDNGSRTFIQFDQDNSQPWTQAWFTYDAQGRLDTQDVINDDGSHTFYNYDQAGASTFAVAAQIYNSSGALTQQVTAWDDGHSSYTYY